jgi:nucleotide-binding universal stress UspA family protein
VRNVLDEREVEHRKVQVAGSVAANIVAESRLGYGMIGVGVTSRHHGQLYSPMVDELLLTSPVPIVIVRRARNQDRPLPGAFSRAVVPVTGTRSSRAAQEVAFSISANLGTEVVLTHVVDRPVRQLARYFTRSSDEDVTVTMPPVAHHLMDAALAQSAELGVTPRTVVREGSSPATTLVATAEAEGADLVVLGASLRNVDGRPFLGHVVETVLEHCDTTVVVVATPKSASG